MIVALENQVYLSYDSIIGIFDYQGFCENQQNLILYEAVRKKGGVVHGSKGEIKTLVMVQKGKDSGLSEIYIYESSISSMTLFHRINRV